MAKSVPPVSMDVEVYKTKSEELEQAPSLVTLVTTGKALLDRGIQSEEDYTAAVRMGNESNSQGKRHEDNFDPLCKGLNSLHKLATGLRAQYAAPWRKLGDALLGAARRWYLEAEAAKKRAEQEVLQSAKRQQAQTAQQAQELIDQGFVKEGRAMLMEAKATVAPVLPDPVPQVEGARVTPKYKGACEDITAVMAEILAGRIDLMWEVKPGDFRPLVAVDQVVLNSIVNRLGPNLKCPGIKVERDVQIGATRL